ncbi:hypothetical protein VP1G_10683 [Cytospora mali]|uniref:Uncharacterized protein n=1 Tax=Cytospora mali TaxID=578113 RepID=A0A194URQ8_CYTMA|nr:hypothetical protein VP1G_10683 [Valsa mali var. pyri (nom. inval.)]
MDPAKNGIGPPCSEILGPISPVFRVAHKALHWQFQRQESLYSPFGAEFQHLMDLIFPLLVRREPNDRFEFSV